MSTDPYEAGRERQRQREERELAEENARAGEAYRLKQAERLLDQYRAWWAINGRTGAESMDDAQGETE